MKIYLFIIFFPLIFCSKNLFEIDPELISNLPCEEIIKLCLETISHIKEEKTFDLEQGIQFLIKVGYTIFNGNCTNQLEKLFPKLTNATNLKESLLMGSLHFDKLFEYLMDKEMKTYRIFFTEIFKQNQAFFKNFGNKVKYDENAFNEILFKFTGLSKYKTIFKTFKFLKFGGNGLLAVSKIYTKFNTCKKKTHNQL